MRHAPFLLIGLVFALGCTQQTPTATSKPPVNATPAETPAANQEQTMTALSYEMPTLAGEAVSLSKYQGNVVLMVNVASECGLTPQYEQLQTLHKKYAEKGLSVIGFPCNQFGGQEPGSADQIQQFCSQNYGVEFDMFAKVDVNGENACELYKFLTQQDTQPAGAGDIGWNFEKFLIGRDGNIVGRYSPRTAPDAPELVEAIETALSQPAG